MRRGCACPKCVECCKREPGWFIPDEVPIAAAFMKMPEKDFVEKFCEEHREGDVLAISPARKMGSTECVFLNRDGKCAIHEVKPYECRKVFGCEAAHRHRKIREMIRRQWEK
jgi:Fe-S-cluster containining protein